jgi:hypothetical protein
MSMAREKRLLPAAVVVAYGAFCGMRYYLFVV